MPLTGFNTLLDVMKLDAGIGREVVDETIAFAPELQTLPFSTISGTALELSVLDALPSASFRNANEGTPRKKAEFKTKIFNTAIVDQQVAVDRAGVLNASKDQARFLMNQSKPHAKAVQTHICKQMWYGIESNDAKGFVGLLKQYAADADHEVDVTGADDKSSVWFFQVGGETLSFFGGNDSSLSMNADWKEETVYDASGNPFQAVTNYITGRIGFKLENKHAAVRIKNIGIAANKTLTDAHMFSALALCEALGMVPNLIVGHPRSFEQLRKSRTATNPQGAPVSRLLDWEGVPLLRTINLSVDEA